MSKFYDSYGKIVKDGDRILIEENYNFPDLNGKDYTIKWDAAKGMYRFHKQPDCSDYGDDFYGIHTFKKVNNKKR